MACLLYHEDKVLVTNDNFLPVIEVDENYPRKIHNDFYWFFKVTKFVIFSPLITEAISANFVMNTNIL